MTFPFAIARALAAASTGGLFAGYGSWGGFLDCIVPDNGNIPWCGNADFDLIAFDFDDGDNDVFANRNLLIGLARECQHNATPFGKRFWAQWRWPSVGQIKNAGCALKAQGGYIRRRKMLPLG
jgi:hypothetical protein